MKNKLIYALFIFAFTYIAPSYQAAFGAQMDEAFKTVSRYNLGRQLTGTISANPGGHNDGHYRATRHTYSDSGLLIKTETGWLSSWQDESVAPSAWSEYTIVQKTEFKYGHKNLKVSELTTFYLSSGETEQTLTQYSYNERKLVRCKAVRMNAAIFSSLFENSEIDACTLQTEGEFGPDRITLFYYNFWNKLSQEYRAVGTDLQQRYAYYFYNEKQIISTVVDANGNRSQGGFDGFGRLTKWKYPEKGTSSNDFTGTGNASEEDFEEYKLDNNGNRIEIQKRNGNTIVNTFDDLNRVIQVDGGDVSQDITYTYDLRDLQTSAIYTASGIDNFGLSYELGKGVTTEYNGFGEITTSVNNASGTSRTLTYEYDLNGNRERVIHPDTVWFEYKYDNLNRLTYILENATAETNSNRLVHQTYHAAGQQHVTTFGNDGVVSTFNYDGMTRLKSFGHVFSGNEYNLSVEYGYLPSNQIASREFNNESYINSASQTLTGIYQVNGLNQYVCQDDDSTSCASGDELSYDENGNLNAYKGVSYFYDDENRLRKISKNGVDSIFRYDPMGRLVKAESDGESIEFLYDGDALVAEFDGSVMTARYAHGSRVDNPLVAYSDSRIGASHRTYLHADHQGSIVAHSDNSGARTHHNTYDEYGVPGINNDGRFAYTGQINLPFSQLYHYKARVYHPKLGRFLQTDPVGYEDQMNLYAYVHNDPMTYTDPTGEFGIVGALIGGLAELGTQVALGQDINVTKIAVSAAAGAVTGGVASLAKAASTVAGKSVATLGQKVANATLTTSTAVVAGSGAGAINSTIDGNGGSVVTQDAIVSGISSAVGPGKAVGAGVASKVQAVAGALGKQSDDVAVQVASGVASGTASGTVNDKVNKEIKETHL